MYPGDYYEYRAPTERKLLDAALSMISRAGAHSMSFQDLADTTHIKKASVHYYFPTKADLLVALVDGYRSGFLHELRTFVGRCPTGAIKLRQYFGIFHASLCDDRLCPCGMLAAESVTLKLKVSDEVVRFFDDCAEELKKILMVGLEDGSLRFEGPPEPLAWMILLLIQGASLLSRSTGDRRLLHEQRRALERFLVAPGHEQKLVKNGKIVAGGAPVPMPLTAVSFANLDKLPKPLKQAPAEASAVITSPDGMVPAHSATPYTSRRPDRARVVLR